jgi:hypothetical protein
MHITLIAYAADNHNAVPGHWRIEEMEDVRPPGNAL